MNGLLWMAIVLGCLAGAGASWIASEPTVIAYAHAMAARWRIARKAKLGLGWLSGATRAMSFEAGRSPFFPVRLVRVWRERRAKVWERELCLSELSELIDVVALGLSAGISFDASLDIYCARYKTVLADRLGDAMNSWRLGLTSRKAALKGLASKMGMGAFTAFADTVTESLDFGAPLAKTLSEQSRAIREERRLVVQERIEKAPVKMLIPTGVLILPAMLLVVLGPFLASLTGLAM